MNANFRLGTADNAGAVARFAARDDAPEAMRIEALEMLGAWAKPSGHDRVINGWRPLKLRSAEIAVAALRPALGGVFTGSNHQRQIAAKIAGQLGIKEVVPELVEMAADTSMPAELRVQAMAAIEQLGDARVNATVAAGLKDSEPAVRSEARRILANLRPAEAIGPLENALAKGTPSEQQAAFAVLATIKAPQADGILSQWFDKLLAGKAPREVQLDLLEAATHRGSSGLKEQLAHYESARPKKESIDPFRETLYGGDAQRGHAIFFDRTEVGCVRCHTISGTGGKVGPDLTKIGAEKTREYLLESIVDPNKVIAKGFETVVLALDDGRQIAGILKSEDAKELKLITPEGKLVTIEKSQIDQRTTGKSAMPQDVAKPLSKSDLRDVVEFLFGAGKSKRALAWTDTLVLENPGEQVNAIDDDEAAIALARGGNRRMLLVRHCQCCQAKRLHGAEAYSDHSASRGRHSRRHGRRGRDSRAAGSMLAYDPASGRLFIAAVEPLTRVRSKLCDRDEGPIEADRSESRGSKSRKGLPSSVPQVASLSPAAMRMLCMFMRSTIWPSGQLRPSA